MADETPKKKGKGKLILILFLLIIIGGAGFAAYKFVIPKFLNNTSDTAANESADNEKGAQADSNSNNPIVALPEFMVNLSDPLGRRYIKLNIEVEVTDNDAAAELEKSRPKIRDAINMLLSSKSYADLAPSENKIMLKNEIVERLNQILGGPKVARVYFVDMVIQ